jgi:hypothetical protein
MSLPAMMVLNGMRRGFALDQFIPRNDRRIGRPLLRAIQLYIPLGQAVHHLLQSRLVAPPTFPIQQLACLLIEGFPDQEFLLLFLDVMPHLIQLQDESPSRGFWLLIVHYGKGPKPVEHRLSGDPHEEGDAVNREATQIQEHRVDLHRERLAARGSTRKLIPTLLAELLGFSGSGAIVD